jgi:SAM-dependent methyltransferase
LKRTRATRLIARVYSFAAGTVYEPLVVNGSFRLLGGRLNESIVEQGRMAAGFAGVMPLLDVPVGTAYFTSRTARRHRGIVVGADVARGMVASAARLARREALDNLLVVQGDIHSLPFKDDSFGAVMCSNGLQVMPNHRRAVTELARVLAPGKRVFVSVLTLPLAVCLPGSWSAHVPAVLGSAGVFVDALTAAGLTVVSVRRSRLALLFEADKPA